MGGGKKDLREMTFDYLLCIVVKVGLFVDYTKYWDAVKWSN